MSTSLNRMITILQSEEQIAQLRALKMVIQAQLAATPEDLVKLIDEQIRAKQRETKRITKLFDRDAMSDKQDTGG